MDATTNGGLSRLDAYIGKRFVTPGDLLNKFNPERLKASGSFTDGVGADPAASGPFYVFVTTPDINLDHPNAQRVLGIGTPTAPDALARKLTGGTGFIKLLSNLALTSPSQDISLDVLQVGEGWDGARQVLPTKTLASRQDGTFQVEYKDMAGLPVHLLHKIWIDYIDAVTVGHLSPKAGEKKYIESRIIDYAVSVYSFQTLPDGETIEFGIRYTGVFPTAVPFSGMAGKLGAAEAIHANIPYAFSYAEPMDAAIFAEFNTAAAETGVQIQVPAGRNSKSPAGRPAYKLTFPGAPSRF